MVAPLVGICMGSESDWPTMKAAADVLTQFGVPFEARVVSAHRTPERMAEYGTAAHERGLKVLIAGAGGAAHLPGMLASYTPLPVIGVPIPTENLRGLDSLLSIVQMPKGVPVATVAIGGAENAGLLAAQILAGRYPDVAEHVKRYRAAQTDSVLNSAEAKGTSLGNLGTDETRRRP